MACRSCPSCCADRQLVHKHDVHYILEVGVIQSGLSIISAHHLKLEALPAGCSIEILPAPYAAFCSRFEILLCKAAPHWSQLPEQPQQQLLHSLQLTWLTVLSQHGVVITYIVSLHPHMQLRWLALSSEHCSLCTDIFAYSCRSHLPASRTVMLRQRPFSFRAHSTSWTFAFSANSM